jgi:hypothetical protein
MERGKRAKMSETTTKPNKGGRPKTGHRALPAVRVPPALYFRLERRLALNQAKYGTSNISKLVRLGLAEKLDALDARDLRRRRKSKSGTRKKSKTPRSS